ncbi:hypothetical protein AUC31_08760 [Planococcus rifietoensis]|uniref:YokE-like PH domain-containing protein n=1 Tax=Planococcus rifietoensis TaxID=200991 RepID=A0A0U2N552_9BACL|nr:hypothetical protein [Planococcus rifietoensis]ALS75305.1 hypothetical protein AUC31_08760 [Planococcus rifietoensis]
MDPKSLLSSITYVDTERSIVAGQMKIIHTEYEIHLYEDKLTASTNEFKLMHVWDISYKTFSDDANLLYLHTHRGVLTYKVPRDPDRFVKTFKKLKNANY